jgi:prepilin-type N-terminal cleavage/methylation domain-containing protein
MKKSNTQQGFTLVELLIAILVAGLLLAAVGALIRDSANASNRINLNADIIKEGQIAQQLITGRLGEAIYIWWPTGTSLSNILLASSGSTTKNTVDGNNSWQWIVNNTVNNRFVAMILPPRAPNYIPGTNSITNCTTISSDGCYRFFAYYPAIRSNLVGDTTLSPSEKPKADPQNGSQWVLMEYRANLFDGSTAWTPNYVNQNGVNRISGIPAATYYQSSAGNSRSGAILVDYIKPGSLKFAITRPTAAIAGVARPDGKVAVSFEMQRLTGSDPSIRATAANNEALGATVSPRNWGCPQTATCP